MIKERNVAPEVYKNSRRFLEFIDRSQIDRTNIKRDIETKKEALRRYGYSALKGKGKGDKQVDIPLDKCMPSRINHALNNTYNEALKNVQIYERGVRTSESYRNICDLIDKESSLSGDRLETARERTAIVFDSASNIELELLSRNYGKFIMGGYFRK